MLANSEEITVNHLQHILVEREMLEGRLISFMSRYVTYRMYPVYIWYKRILALMPISCFL